MVVLQLVKTHYKEVTELLGEPQEVTVASAEGLSSLKDWREVFRITQVKAAGDIDM